MKALFFSFGIVLFFLSTSCQPQHEDSVSSATFTDEAAPLEAANETTVSERKLIKEGRLEFQTTSIDSTRNTVLRATKIYKGYVSSDEAYNTPERTTVTMVVRIPSSEFDNFLQDATVGVKKFDRKDIQAKDVTEEFLDIEARLKTQKALEARYEELLKKANSVSEILEIEKQSGELRAEIESIEGRMRYLENRISLSTITLSFYESNPVKTSLGNEFIRGFVNGWENLISFFVLLVNIWPVLILIAAVIVWLRLSSKNKKQ
ncbi:MAG: DUF4349 domain-containing protein [Bacteroidia bacterium]